MSRPAALIDMMSRVWTCLTSIWTLPWILAIVIIVAQVIPERPLYLRYVQSVAPCIVSADRNACYRDTIPSLYPATPVADIFGMMRFLQSRHLMGDCHNVAHDLARVVVADDPSLWWKFMSLQPEDGTCSFGFIHGVAIAAFRDRATTPITLARETPIFEKACMPRDGFPAHAIERNSCYHALGHMFYYVENADQSLALGLCDRFVPDMSSRETCYGGTMMPIFWDTDTESIPKFATSSVPNMTRNSFQSFCASFNKPEYVAACMRAAWPLFESEIMDGTGVDAFCALEPIAFQNRCYARTFIVMGWKLFDNMKRVHDACNNVMRSRRAECLSGIAEEGLATLGSSRSARYAIQACASGDSDITDRCLRRIVSTVSELYVNDVEGQRRFCAGFPDAYEDICVRAPDN